MPHINEKIDFTVGALIVYQDKILLVDHIKLKKWLMPGGHIELDEDPDQGLFREVEEETGLKKADLEVLCFKPDFVSAGTKTLYTPTFIDIHDISGTHKHVGLIYLMRAKTDQISLAEGEHNAIRWFSKEELEDPKYNLAESMKCYALEALKKAV